VVVDTRGRLPFDSRLVRSAMESPVILASTDEITEERGRALSAAGVELMVCKANADGRVDIHDLLSKLGEREITSLLVEGGAQLNEELLDKRVVDKMLLFLAPLILSGPNSLPMLAGRREIRQTWKAGGCRIVGDDVMLEVYPAERGGS
jgi:diaminohydroxyphosphoribosylaminopyrimidine deaminase/5-amino-6-(5-phosphoribosylamino)uracil reductase